MDVFEAIKKRRSIRKFDPKKQVSEKQVDKLLEAARWAPTAGNLQSFFIYAVRGELAMERIAEVSKYQNFIREASVVFVVCVDYKQVEYYGERGRMLYCIQDAAIATENMWLVATEMGLGAVWVGNIDEKKAADILKIPKHFRAVSLLVVGYPAENPKTPKRKSVEEISKKV